MGADTPGRWPRGPLGLVALAEASGVGIAAALTAAGAGEDSGAAASAAEASGEATATAARRATRHPGLGSAAGRPIAIETEATATATGASAVGMTLVVPGAHLMTDLAAATVTGARGTRARPAATWSPSGPGNPGRMVGIVTETTAGPGTTGLGTTGRRETRGPGTTTGSGTMMVEAGTTSRGRSAAINHIVLRWVSACALPVIGGITLFFVPFLAEGKQEQERYGVFVPSTVFVTRQGRISIRPVYNGLCA